MYDYFIEDHLGNIRMVLTEEVDQVGYVSTFEQPKDAVEPPIFGPQRDATKEEIPTSFPYYDADPNAANKYHSRLNASDVNRRTGSSVILKVMAGDALDISVKAFYKSTDPVPAGGSVVNDMVQSLIDALLGNQTSVVPNGKGNLVSGNSAIVNQSDIGNFINGTQNDPNNQLSDKPKAYLNYVLFDENFAAVGNGYKRVNTADIQTVYSFPGVSVPVNGYVYVWLSNESGMNVYFDDVSVQHTTGPIVHENTFYPYGLPIEPLSSYAAIKTANKELYQSKLLDDEMGLNLYYFDARYFDPQTGRFLGIDPKMQLASGYQGMGGNPAMFVDPDGQFFFIPMLIGAAVGALSSGAIYSATSLASQKWTLGGFLKSIAFGAVSGAISGGIGQIGGALAQNVAFNMVANTAAQIGTNLAFGNHISLGMIAGSLVSGALSSSFGNYSGVAGGALKNIGAELGFNTFKYGVTGAVSGSIAAAFDGGNVGQGFINGAKYGAIGGATLASLNILSMGASYKPENVSNEDFGKFKPTYRTGTFITRAIFKEGSGVTIGRNLITHLAKPGGVFDSHGVDIKDFNKYLQTHETGHYHDEQSIGFGKFYGRIFSEYRNYGVRPSYSREGTLEFQAQMYSKYNNGYYYTVNGRRVFLGR